MPPTIGPWGFCYLNNVAIAALTAVAAGAAKRIYDFDVHHGNGTEPSCSIIPRSCFFPSTNTQLSGNRIRPGGKQLLQLSGGTLLATGGLPRRAGPGLGTPEIIEPDLLAVSAGFDAYVHDPIAQGSLEIEDYHWLGKRIRSLVFPCFHVLEGGYSHDLPELILAYLQDWKDECRLPAKTHLTHTQNSFPVFGVHFVYDRTCFVLHHSFGQLPQAPTERGVEVLMAFQDRRTAIAIGPEGAWQQRIEREGVLKREPLTDTTRANCDKSQPSFKAPTFAAPWSKYFC